MANFGGIYGPNDILEAKAEGKIIGFIVGVLVSCLVGAMVSLLSPDPYPRLIGYGCEGTTYGVLYANEEDHFPHPCKRIEAAF